MFLSNESLKPKPKKYLDKLNFIFLLTIIFKFKYNLKLQIGTKKITNPFKNINSNLIKESKSS